MLKLIRDVSGAIVVAMFITLSLFGLFVYSKYKSVNLREIDVYGVRYIISSLSEDDIEVGKVVVIKDSNGIEFGEIDRVESSKVYIKKSRGGTEVYSTLLSKKFLMATHIFLTSSLHKIESSSNRFISLNEYNKANKELLDKVDSYSLILNFKENYFKYVLIVFMFLSIIFSVSSILLRFPLLRRA